MEIKIGIADVARELTIHTESSGDDIVDSLSRALENGSLFEIMDVKGRRVLIPAARVGYLDLGATESRPVGFGAL